MFSQIKLILVGAICLASSFSICGAAEPEPTVAEVTAAMKKAATFFREKVALRGGYVYYYSPDLNERWGEGKATATQIWVQPPGTPAVGEAYLEAYAMTLDKFYLDAALEAALALRDGQLQSGGWANKIDFDRTSKECGLFRNGQGNSKGRNYSTLDDNATQSAIVFLNRCFYQSLPKPIKFLSIRRGPKMTAAERRDLHKAEFKAAQEEKAKAKQHRLDEDPQQTAVWDSLDFANKKLLDAQFPNGGFPQVFSGPAPDIQPVPATYPTYDWRTEQREKEYWNLYTLNDGLCGKVADVLIETGEMNALKKLGNFLILAQMPDPQPAWAQQYNFHMHPAWARKFEPPAIAGSESEDAIETLMKIAVVTGDDKYSKPIPAALAYLKKSELADGQLARFYELKTNKPLYFNSKYELTFSDEDLPTHYGFKKKSSVDRLEKRYQKLLTEGLVEDDAVPKPPKDAEVAKILAALDDRGRWISTYNGESLTGQPKFKPGTKYIASNVFSENLQKLSLWLAHRESAAPKK